ncbi:DUF1178 family protein [Brevundimonas sp. 2R-24]|uniref:DUF1178 family protein n=1 Tax=Peiella sedimenti TaxID=3061083 RepID=A0ABT8SN80_9CAUL|nr:DUF1178 family protein [Caulobacteraceae bacterium XZ-24]
MIRYALTCPSDHDFEAWFASSAAYDDQAERGLVECPFCASREVRKQIMAPAVKSPKRAAAPEAPDPRLQTLMMEAAKKVRAHVEENFDYVGDAFAREARAIHEGSAEKREIYGEATGKEVAELRADGVPFAPLPPAPVDPDKLN